VADGVLARGTQSISDLISVSAFINLDFADVCSVMKNAGHAHMGVGSATGKDKAELAAKAAISSPLLESSITGAHGILINITASPDVGLEDVDVASSLIAAEAAPDANVIWGVNFDNELEDEMRITIIATGFDNQKSFAKPAAAPVAAPAAPVAPVEAPKAAPKAEAPKREKPKSSADEELDRLMKEFGTPKKKKINR
jgi:cell division protein FtsZ